MNIIFVADIFGVTEEFNHLCRQVTANIERLFDENHSLNVKYHLIGPYQHDMSKFLCEQEAYQYFIQHVNLDGYVNVLEQQVSAISGPKILIGFSVGGVLFGNYALKVILSIALVLIVFIVVKFGI
ncbi:hypothetical protein [Colwellia sp. Arc7-D]|uniref:hypothetical protein n=1 Tax=Colwellia sp. Arc7-D TaxID=2161872 RepID=UPI000D3B4922|nr:hypothetical protein [Colwellia sp. Arc7-D]AWB58720.1 hypothetical protein DBO93_14935 [Colwellia sp. Arc7-D]